MYVETIFLLFDTQNLMRTENVKYFLNKGVDLYYASNRSQYLLNLFLIFCFVSNEMLILFFRTEEGH